MMKFYGDENDHSQLEIGIDEAGRGPLFGRVYTAAVILPKTNTEFDYTKVKDSKLFHSKKKIEEAANYIKENALHWAVTYEDEKVIDNINVLQATQQSMHKSIREIVDAIGNDVDFSRYFLLVDGNYFNPYTRYNKDRQIIEIMPHICVEGGDNKYAAIAAASILAKVARDTYIDELCVEYPDLIEKYGIDKNKGYGTPKHLNGIRQFGITEWHRKSFGICKKKC
jgi:ribonuclease HII